MRLSRGGRGERDPAAPRRVAYLHDNVDFGGIETLQLGILRHLDGDRYHAVVVLAEHTDETASRFRQLLADAGVRLFTVPPRSSSRATSAVSELWRLRRLLREQGIDVTHIQTRTPSASRRLTVAAWLAATPARLRTEHVSPGPHVDRSTRWKVLPFDAMTHLIVTDSRADLGEQLALVHRSPAKVVQSYCGIDADAFDPGHDIAAAKSRLGIDPATTVIGTVGRLHEQKGHRYLVDAAARIAARRGAEGMRFVIVGDGPEEDALRAQAIDSDVVDLVQFAGYQPDPLTFMEAMDIVVMPSLWEGFSISMQEFMALGKAMVVSDHHSFLEAMEPGIHALVVPMRDGVALADAIEQLLDDAPRRAALGAAAAARVRERFSLAGHVNELMGFYDGVLDRRARIRRKMRRD